MSKPTETYIAVQNCLVNELSLSKEVIAKMVEDRVDKIVEKKIKSMMNDTFIDRIVQHRIRERMDKGLPGGSYMRDSFDKYVKACIERVISGVVREEYNINIIKKGQSNGE